MTFAQSPPHLVTLILLTAVSTLTLNMFLPALAVIAEDLNADYALVSLSVSGYLATTAVVLLIVGPLSDRYGRRPVMLGALAIFTVASIACALAQSVWVFLAFRLLQAGMASGYAISMAIVRDTTSAQKSAGLIGFINMAMALAPMLGPMLGGVMTDAFGWLANFVFYSVTGCVLLVLCLFDLGETRKRAEKTDARVTRPIATLLSMPKFWSFILCTAFSTGAFYIFLTGAALVAQTTFGVSVAQLGFYIGSITGGYLVGSFVAGVLGPHVRPTTLMLLGRVLACAGLAVGLGVLAISGSAPLTYFGATIFVGLGNGITMPGSGAGALSVRPDLAGTAAGLNGAMTVAVGAVLTSIAGVVMAWAGGPGVLMGMMFAAAFAGLLSALWARKLDTE